MRSLFASLILASLAMGQDPINAVLPSGSNVFAHEGSLYAFALVPYGGASNPLVRFRQPGPGVRPVRIEIVAVGFLESRPCASLPPNRPRINNCGDWTEFMWDEIRLSPSIEMRGPTIEASRWPGCYVRPTDDHYLTYASIAYSSPCGGDSGPELSLVLMRIIFT